MQVEVDIAGFARLGQSPGPAAGFRTLVLGRPERNMTQRQQHVVAQCAGEEVRRGADIADAPADHGERQRGDVDAADRDPTAGRLDQAREQQRQLIFAAAALADDRNMPVERDAEVDGVDDAAAILLGERQIGDDEFAGQRRHRFRFGELQPGVHHAGGLELLDDLLVLDPGILECSGRNRAARSMARPDPCRRQHRQQRANRKPAADHQVAADRIEEKRRKLPEKVVKKL